MTWHPRVVFALIVRTYGLYLLTQAVPYVGSFIDIKLYPTPERPQPTAAAHLIYATLDLSLAALFLFGTGTVVAWIFGAESGPSADRAEPER